MQKLKASKPLTNTVNTLDYICDKLNNPRNDTFELLQNLFKPNTLLVVVETRGMRHCYCSNFIVEMEDNKHVYYVKTDYHSNLLPLVRHDASDRRVERADILVYPEKY